MRNGEYAIGTMIEISIMTIYQLELIILTIIPISAEHAEGWKYFYPEALTIRPVSIDHSPHSPLTIDHNATQ